MKKAIRILATTLGLVTIAALDFDSASAQSQQVAAAYSVSATTVPAVPNTDANGTNDAATPVSFAAPQDSLAFDTWYFQRHLMSELGLDEAPSIFVTLKDQIMNPKLPGGVSMSAGSSNGLRHFRQYRVLDHMMPGLKDEARMYHVTIGVRF